nr:PhnD/SsuA/transferrin family substrate-binding protein [uncultured Desulfobacter sp.]
MGTINENDVKAALGVWIRGLTKEMDIPVDVTVRLYLGLSDIKSDLAANRVDVLYITTPQFYELLPLMAEDALLTVKQSGSMTEAYIIVVHQDSPADDVQDLKGKDLRVLDNARTTLSLSWLNVFLWEKGLGKAGAYFESYKMVEKINDAVLPVFFKQAYACMVTQKGFEIMAELNPQIARQMKILATSAYYIPIIVGFRKSYKSLVKQMVLKNFQEMIGSSSGSQLLTIFQNDGMQQISTVELSESFTLLKKEHSLLGGAQSGKTRGADNP